MSKDAVRAESRVFQRAVRKIHSAGRARAHLASFASLLTGCRGSGLGPGCGRTTCAARATVFAQNRGECKMNRPLEVRRGPVTAIRKRLLAVTCQSERTIMLGTILLVSAVSAATG